MKTKTKTMSEKLWVGVAEIVPNPAQPRRYFDAEGLKRTGASLKLRQNQPVTVIPHQDPKRPGVRWMLVDGERRWRAAKLEKMERLWIIVDGDVKDEAQLHEVSFAANWCREGHTHRETAGAIDLLVQRGRTYEDIAEMVGKSQEWAQKEHKLLCLAEEVLALLDAPTPKNERIPIAVALALAAYPAGKQMALWRKHKGQGGKAAFHHIRTAAPRVSARSRGDDVRYIKAQVTQAAGIVQRLNGLPQTMMRSLDEASAVVVVERLVGLAQSAGALAELLRAVRGGEE